MGKESRHKAQSAYKFIVGKGRAGDRGEGIGPGEEA